MKSAFAGLVASLGAAVEEVSSAAVVRHRMTGLQRAVQFRDVAGSMGRSTRSHPGKLSAKLVEVIGDRARA